jgi:competence protein ComEC
VTSLLLRRWPQSLAASLCLGLAAANAARVGGLALLAVAMLLASAFAVEGSTRLIVVASALAVSGWWWGSVRLDVLDQSPLAERIGTAARARAVVTAPPRVGRYDVRVPALVFRFGDLRVREPVLLRLARDRAPPQGVILEGVGQLAAPRGPRNGFDERAWLRRQGIHAVLRIERWHLVGRRGGVGGIADSLRRRLQRTIAVGLTGDRAAVLKGVVLGEDTGLSEGLRQRFRASGLYHLLAVSGQNVGLVAGGALILVWLLGLSRQIGHVAALAAIAAYVLAVGAQPSVVRAGIAGCLVSLAWITARAADRWHLLLVAAVALLAWNPYTLLDAGFQFSFAAVIAIFTLVPRLERFLEGYPLGRPLRLVVAVSTACGLVTAPIAWAHFHSVQLLTVPANALAAPAVVPLLGLGLAAAAVAPLSASAAAALAWLNGWCAAYLAAVARLVGGLPFAQIQSTRVLLILLAGALVLAAYAWPRWRASSSPFT